MLRIISTQEKIRAGAEEFSLREGLKRKSFFAIPHSYRESKKD